jgi:hypothetical protein
MRKPLSPEMIEESALHALFEPLPAGIAKLPAAPLHEVDIDLTQGHSNFKNIALFVAAPFIGLAYALLLPLVGLAMLGWIGAKALLAQPATRKVLKLLGNVAKVMAAPFIGLAYAVMLPFVGTAMLVWVGAKALLAPVRTT